MKQILASSLICLSLYYLSGCGMYESVDSGKELVRLFYKAIQEADFKKAANYIGKTNKKSYGQDYWIKILEDTFNKNGKLKNYTVEKWDFVTKDNGAFLIIETKVHYEKKSWKEKIIIFEVDQTTLKIAGYKQDIIDLSKPKP